MIGHSDGTSYDNPINAALGRIFPEFNPTSPDKMQVAGTTSFDTALKDFPKLQEQGLAHKQSPAIDQNMLEFWPAGETGSSDRPRPSELPIDKHGVETFGNRATPLDVLGDVVSHHMVNSDPTIAGHYQEFKDSLTPDQHERLKGQYEHAQANEGEKRSFDDWKDATGLPAYFRGYAFKQWPAEFNDKAYTPEQRGRFDSMMDYLKSKGDKVAGDLPGRYPWKEIDKAPVIDFDHERIQNLPSNQRKYLDENTIGIQDKGEYYRMRLPAPKRTPVAAQGVGEGIPHIAGDIRLDDLPESTNVEDRRGESTRGLGWWSKKADLPLTEEQYYKKNLELQALEREPLARSLGLRDIDPKNNLTVDMKPDPEIPWGEADLPVRKR